MTRRALTIGVLTLCGAAAHATEPFPAEAARIVSLDPRFDALVAPDASLEIIARGHRWLEGPAWNAAEGALYYSDIPANTIYRWSADDGVHVFLTPAGYSGDAPFRGREPGSNGLAFDVDGRLLICEHGDRRITRLESSGARTVLADRYRGRRLNSPNDVIFASNGDLYFTDPPFGLPDTFTDPARELDVQGIYRRSSDGTIELLIDDVEAPNGIALSLDERTLYVTDVGPSHPAWLAFDLTAEGRAVNRRVLADAAPWMQVRRGGPDGLEIDTHGNLFAAGPEGIFVFAPDGKLLGLIDTGVPTANVEWGDDGHTLFIAAESQILRLRTLTRAPDPGSPIPDPRFDLQPPVPSLQPGAGGAPQ